MSAYPDQHDPGDEHREPYPMLEGPLTKWTPEQLEWLNALRSAAWKKIRPTLRPRQEQP